MGKINKLVGSPWHISYLSKSPDDLRRHQRRCKHFDNKYCCLRRIRCFSSAHCDYYSEKIDIQVNTEIKKAAKPKLQLKTDTFNPNSYLIGEKIIHKKFGLGLVIGVQGHSIIVEFKGFQTKILDFEICSREELISFPQK
ncbi:hypothetical protein [Rodentibacter haemolyticus]|uniref:Uncharacterized protein n=1 Tax=Rodentibacter haemolyticus TaxID=2778911 RepID=A0ABX6UXC5_9PAST|nr:hypothetical protein [Rodentibacter haemolyticus]QPB41925.1 hypothetical protein IHV77_08340 [Rodentibacter haemolyticus]